MFLRNDLLEYAEPDAKLVRILWLKPENTVPVINDVDSASAMPQLTTIAVIIDVDTADALPQLTTIGALKSDIDSGKAKLLTEDMFLTALKNMTLTIRMKEIRDRGWKAINDLVNNEPSIYDPGWRGPKVIEAALRHKTTHTTIYKNLRRYWMRGQTSNAIIPNYANCGGKGTERKSNEGVKRGRPRKYSDQIGLNIGKDDRRIFLISEDRYYATNNKFDRRASFDQMIKDFCCDRTIDPETGTITHEPNAKAAIAGFYTFEQYDYWLGKDSKRLETKRKRLTAKIYDLNMRGLLGTSNAEVWGPGARYQIDATIADVYLVSRLDRNKIIGRPVLYIVIDVFSRMIVGIYVGLEGPSWVGAMMALANTASDKQAFCKKFGRKIEPHEWQCHHLPANILGDKGELEATTIETLMNNFHVDIENAASYRADWKGIVEQRFKLLPAKFKPFVPGYIDVDYRARGGKDYRLDAVLDLDQFTQVIIECVLYYNNEHEIKGYDKDRDLSADNISPVPTELWEWGVANRSGSLRQYPEDLVRFSLLPVDEATVTLNGIKFNGSFYTCQKALEERWFDRARQDGGWKVKISFDPRDMDEIYLNDPHAPFKFDTCQMTEKSRANRQLSLWEIGQQQNSDKCISAKRQPKEQLAKADLSANIEKIVIDAVKQKGEPSTASAASQTKNIRTHRAEEKQSRRESETFRFDSDKSPAKSADILRFPGVDTVNDDEPDITEILGDDDDENT